MTKNRNRGKEAELILMIIVFSAVFLMTCLTPMLADDFSYSFSYADNRRIENIGDIIRSLCAHRQTMNGRIFSHGLTMLFLLLPKMVFNFANAVNAVLLLFLFHKYLENNEPGRTFILVLSSALLIWAFMPVFGQVFLWLDGSLNYSWALTIVMAFLYPFYCAFVGKTTAISGKSWFRILYILFAFMAGGYSENASCAAIFAAMCFAVPVFKMKKLPSYLIIAWISACLGFIFLMTAPAEIGRAAQTDLLGIAKNVQRVFEAPWQELSLLYFLFAALLAAAMVCRADRKTVMAAVIFFLSSLASVLVFVFAVYFPWRSLCASEIFLTVSCVLLLRGIWSRGIEYPAPVLAAILTVNFVFSFVLGLGDIAVMYMESRQRIETIKEGIAKGLDPIEIHQYSSNTKYAACYLLPDVYDDSTLWPNYDIAAYYGAPAIVGIPPVEDFGS